MTVLLSLVASFFCQIHQVGNATLEAISGDGRYAVGRDSIGGIRWTPPGPTVWFPTLSPKDTSTDGSIVVGRAGRTAARWTADGTLLNLGDLPGGGAENSEASGVSADGSVIVGSSSSFRGLEPFVWTAETGMVGLGILDGTFPEGGAYAVSGDGRHVIGWMRRSLSDFERLFIWSHATGVEFPSRARAYDLSFDGRFFVGSGYWWDRESQAVFSFDSSLFGVSRDGQSAVGTTGVRATVWGPRRGLRNLDAALILEYGMDIGTRRFDRAMDISDDGLVLAVNGSPACLIRLPHPLDCLPGDADDDGRITPDDIPDFIAAVLAGSGPARCGYDLYADGRLDGRDVREFVGQFSP